MCTVAMVGITISGERETLDNTHFQVRGADARIISDVIRKHVMGDGRYIFEALTAELLDTALSVNQDDTLRIS